jgi:hypothetical protein
VRSGIRRSASTTGRASRRKSPAPRGTAVAETLENSRWNTLDATPRISPSVARSRRSAITTSLPSRQRATSSAMSSGGCCRSASIGTTASPRAWSRPAASAISLPKLRDSATTRTRGSRAASAESTANVASRLPSSTKTASAGTPRAFSASEARAQNEASPSASL